MVSYAGRRWSAAFYDGRERETRTAVTVLATDQLVMMSLVQHQYVWSHNSGQGIYTEVLSHT